MISAISFLVRGLSHQPFIDDIKINSRIFRALIVPATQEEYEDYVHAEDRKQKKEAYYRRCPIVITGGSADGVGNVQNTGSLEADGFCRDYDDFFNRTRYTVPEGVLTEDGQMESFNNDLVIRYLDRVVVREDCYEVIFKAGVTVEVEI